MDGTYYLFAVISLLEKHVGATLFEECEREIAEGRGRHVVKMVVVSKIVQDLPLSLVSSVGLAQIEIILGVVINLSSGRVELVQSQAGIVRTDLISKHGLAGGHRWCNEQVRYRISLQEFPFGLICTKPATENVPEFFSPMLTFAVCKRKPNKQAYLASHKIF